MPNGSSPSVTRDGNRKGHRGQAAKRPFLEKKIFWGHGNYKILGSKKMGGAARGS